MKSLQRLPKNNARATLEYMGERKVKSKENSPMTTLDSVSLNYICEARMKQSGILSILRPSATPDYFLPPRLPLPPAVTAGGNLCGVECNWSPDEVYSSVVGISRRPPQQKCRDVHESDAKTLHSQSMKFAESLQSALFLQNWMGTWTRFALHLTSRD